MYSYDIDYYIHVLEGQFSPRPIDDNSKKKLKEIFSLLDDMKPTRENSERRTFWVRVSNGNLADFTKKDIERNGYEDDYDDGEVDDLTMEKKREQWKKYACEEYKAYYPGNYKWYKIDALYHTDRDDQPFYGMMVNNTYVLAIGDPNTKGSYDIDATEFIEELKNRIQDTVSLIKNRKYEEWLFELPYEDRYGTINRKILWNIFPELRNEFRARLTEEEISEFVQIAESMPEKYNPAMTARDFFEACAVGYRAAGYEPQDYNRYNDTEEEHVRYGGLTPKEMYSWYADGRDDGLCNVPLDDSEEFDKWTRQKGDYFVSNGHHPYEIVGSASLIFSIHLYPRKTENGWELILSSSRAGRSTEMVKMFLAMRRAGIPIIIDHADDLVARYTETDLIGVLPKFIGAFGPYAHQAFPIKVSDVIELPDEKDEKYQEMCEKVEWIQEVVPEFE